MEINDRSEIVKMVSPDQLRLLAAEHEAKKKLERDAKAAEFNQEMFKSVVAAFESRAKEAACAGRRAVTVFDVRWCFVEKKLNADDLDVANRLVTHFKARGFDVFFRPEVVSCRNAPVEVIWR